MEHHVNRKDSSLTNQRGGRFADVEEEETHSFHTFLESREGASPNYDTTSNKGQFFARIHALIVNY